MKIQAAIYFTVNEYISIQICIYLTHLQNTSPSIEKQQVCNSSCITSYLLRGQIQQKSRPSYCHQKEF